ncbi:hypothetical protein C6N75_02805 [Streptomyces solincola]|uniref:LysM domain-containing protein n=1 Tax=Streptomyces solincola TaxID=2100817 RepID=A0A2S9Q223_9ACTN|nr:hypothetical protein C6N75_02805 [Streptomyces solincola]
MRSGNGRHRRPRQAPAIVVAAGVTGSAIAIPLLGAGSASAADAATWDRVAECESGGMWSADLGNGFYGGLQMTQETWESNGGLSYAARPDLASRAQQIAVAERAYAARGAAAWQTCAPIAGLGQEQPGAGAPSAEAAPEPESAPSAETRQGERDAVASPAPAPEEEAAAADSAPTFGRDGQGASASADPAPRESESAAGTGRHRGRPAPEEKPAADASADPAAPAGREEQEPAADPAPPAGRTPAASDAAEGGQDAADGPAGRGDADAAHPSRGESTERGLASADPGAYTVQPGDNLTAIARERALDGGWSALYEANKDTVGADPDLILPGQSLALTDGQQAAQGPDAEVPAEAPAEK